MKTLPLYSEDLVKELDKLYPNQCPDIRWEDRVIWFKAGQREVVNTLLQRLEFTKKKKLE